jgi:Flp pilus assembly protein TadB
MGDAVGLATPVTGALVTGALVTGALVTGALVSGALVTGALVGLAVALAVPSRARWPGVARDPPSRSAEDRGWLRCGRSCWALLAGSGAALFVSGSAALPAGCVVAVCVWVWAGRAEPGSVRRRRERVERELPALVQLLAGALESGSDVGEALRVVCHALAGPASAQLAQIPARLSLGMSPEEAWQPAVADPLLAPLGRTMVRTHRTGSSVVHEVGRLADELERRSQLRVEERARAVGVKAAIPLTVCLLPSFLLVGVVPLAVGLLRSLSL